MAFVNNSCMLIHFNFYFSFRLNISDTDNCGSDSMAGDVMNLVKHALFRCKSRKSYKRVFLAATAIQAISFQARNQHNLAEEYISCLRMYFEATPDPLISVFEVRNLLYACLFLVKKLRLVENYYQTFEKLMPECSEKLQPRKLTDLTRCQIRKNLSQTNVPLPAAVEKLSLPKRLQNFVVGDWIDISSKSINVSLQEAVKRSKVAGQILKRQKLCY